MKDFAKIVLSFSLLAVLAFGCEREVIEPISDNSVALEAKISPGNTVSTEVTAPAQIDLVDESSNVVGTLDVSNNSNFFYLYSSLSHGWLLTDAKIFAGDRNNLPKVNGSMDLEELPFQMHLQNPSMTSTVQIPRGPLALCNDFAFWFRAQQFDFWGNVVASIEGWANGTSILDGHVFTYCAGSVANNGQTNDFNTSIN